MFTERQQNAASLSRVVATFACVFLLACSCLSLTGCSNATVKEEPRKKKSVVQDLNVVPDSDGSANAASEGSANGGSSAKEQVKPEDEIESLPFEPQEDQPSAEEKELPVLEE